MLVTREVLVNLGCKFRSRGGELAYDLNKTFVGYETIQGGFWIVTGLRKWRFRIKARSI